MGRGHRGPIKYVNNRQNNGLLSRMGIVMTVLAYSVECTAVLSITVKVVKRHRTVRFGQLCAIASWSKASVYAYTMEHTGQRVSVCFKQSDFHYLSEMPIFFSTFAECC